MKRLLLILTLSVLFFSCTKQQDQMAPPVKSYSVTVNATSAEGSSITIAAVGTQNFEKDYSRTFTVKSDQPNIYVMVHSDKESAKTITISINGEQVARRATGCGFTDYDLSYNLSYYRK